MWQYFAEGWSYRVETDGRDTYPNNFKCWVYLLKDSTQMIYKRRGYGKFIGNFSPIWIKWRPATSDGRMVQLTELERIIRDLEVPVR